MWLLCSGPVWSCSNLLHRAVCSLRPDPLLLEARVGFLLNGAGGPGLKGGRSGVFFSALAGSSPLHPAPGGIRMDRDSQHL